MQAKSYEKIKLKYDLSKKNTPHVNKYAAIIVLLTAEAVKSWFLYAGDRRAPPLGWRGGLKKYTHFFYSHYRLSFTIGFFLFMILYCFLLFYGGRESEVNWALLISHQPDSYISAFCTYCMHFLSLSIPLQAPMYI